MASGKTHKKVSLALSIKVGIAAGVITADPQTAVFTAAGILFSIFCSPDLDIEQMTISKREAVKSFGLFGWLWAAYWHPYAWLIPHRHWTSHSIWGTPIRIAYIHLPLIVLLLVQPEQESRVAEILSLSFSYYGTVFWLGLLVGDLAHLTADSMPWFPRRKKR